MLYWYYPLKIRTLRAEDCHARSATRKVQISLARLMVSIAAANDLELHSVDIEQAFTQADKLKEGANGRYFSAPTPDTGRAINTCQTGSPRLGTSLLFMRC